MGKQHTSSQTVAGSAWGSDVRILKIQLKDLKCDLISIFFVNMILLVKCVHCGINTVGDGFLTFVICISSSPVPS